ncbi:hypothetical protein AC249_AIPGENE22960, partial [Exaiptasia diaphana]
MAEKSDLRSRIDGSEGMRFLYCIDHPIRLPTMHQETIVRRHNEGEVDYIFWRSEIFRFFPKNIKPRTVKMISGWTASNITAAASWSQQYDTKPEQSSNNVQSSNSADTSENKPAENPAWEKAKQALAKVAASSPQKAKPVQNANNNVVNTAVVPPYRQYYQAYGYPGYAYPPPGTQFNVYANTYPSYFPQNGATPTPPVPYQSYGQGPSQVTPKSESPSTQSRPTAVGPRGQSNTNNQAPAPSQPGPYNRPFHSPSGPARNSFQKRM